MTPGQMRVEVALLCGWTWTPWGKDEICITAPPGYRTDRWFTDDPLNRIRMPLKGMSFEEGITRYHGGTPDYPNSLDAMAEAERTLSNFIYVPDSDGQRTEVNMYLTWLHRICGHGNPVFATAIQRAKAFLKTKGKRQDGDG